MSSPIPATAASSTMAAATTTTRSADYASALFSSPPPRKRKPLEAVEATASPAANCGAAAPESQGAPAKRAKETDAQPAAGESAGGGRAAAAAGGDDCPVCLAPMRAGEMAVRDFRTAASVAAAAPTRR